MKVEEIFKEVNEGITIYRYENGFMVEISGRNHEEEWITKKIICSTIEEIFTLVKDSTKVKLS